MKVPSKLLEKILSAIQIAKITGEIKTGLYENIRALESNKVKYLVFPLDIRPRNDKIKKKLVVLRMLAKDKKAFIFEFSTKQELSKLVGLDTTLSSIAIIDAGRAKSLFKSLAREMAV